MKKILQAFDGATTKKPVQGANDMKKFVSIVRESTNPYTPAQESVITSFEEGSVGGDANAFLLAADTIQDEVMAQVNKIKINADEASLRDMMDKFNAFMTAYHNVGKGILQPDMFNDEMGESVEEGRHGYDDSGMSLAPGNDEGPDSWDYSAAHDRIGAGDPRPKRSAYQAPQDKPVMTGMFFYNVKPGEEQTAASLGIKQTKSGKWAKTKYNTSGHTFNFQKDKADKEFGVGKWWSPKTESVEQGVAEGQLNELFDAQQEYYKLADGQVVQVDYKQDLNADGQQGSIKVTQVNPKLMPMSGLQAIHNWDKARPNIRTAIQKWVQSGQQGVVEGEKRMSRAAKGNEKYGKDGMKALAKAGREGASEEQLDKIRDKHDKYDEGLSFKDYMNLAEAKKGLE